jgi:predicted DNA-binding transcriptional regulator AlpA
MQVTKRFIRRPELVAKVGLCATTIFNLERAGKFPSTFC